MNLNDERLKSDLHDLGGSGAPMPNVVNNTIVNSMDLRDAFAMAALQGITSQSQPPFNSQMKIAEFCYNFADAMLAERVR